MRNPLRPVLLAACLVPAVVPATAGGADLESATIPRLQRAMAAGRLTSEALTATYLDEIAVRNGGLRAVISTATRSSCAACAVRAR